MSAFVSAVIVAAGGSVRMGIADSKQFIPLLSRPAIEYTLRAFQKCHLIKEIVIVCRVQDNDRINKIIELNGFSKVSKLVKGGDSRADSVTRNGAVLKCGFNSLQFKARSREQVHGSVFIGYCFKLSLAVFADCFFIIMQSLAF